jgi:hypothetical protein
VLLLQRDHDGVHEVGEAVDDRADVRIQRHGVSKR